MDGLTPSLLVLNAGSSSLKFSIFRAESTDLTLAVRGQISGLGDDPRLTAADGTQRTLIDRALGDQAGNVEGALRVLAKWLDAEALSERVVAVGHRVVHGGAKFVAPVQLDDAVARELEALVPLAPLHLPDNLSVIRAVGVWQPRWRQVACFDTAFHRTHSQFTDVYALPLELYDAGIRRYGFHGLSYEYLASMLPALGPEIAEGRVIVAHLGNGASLCAMTQGRSVDTTMGFSVLDGIPMGTRPGALDPGILIYLARERGMSPDDLEGLLYRKSGLLGLSGVSHDMRELVASSNPRARLAIDYFIWRIAKEIGALSASLGGLDALIFTAGIGEHSPPIRARILETCAWLGVSIDADANLRGGPRISMPGSRVSAWVVPTNEELAIARHTAAVTKLSG
jgi:acetate kinase